MVVDGRPERAQAPTAAAKPCLEEVLEPDLVIIDPHRHFFDMPGDSRYALPGLVDDIRSGHNVVATVCVEWQGQLPSAVAEVGFASSMAEDARVRYANLQTLVCAGIVGGIDLMLGESVEPILLSQIEAAGGEAGRLKGVRYVTASDAHQQAWSPHPARPEGLLRRPEVRRGFDKAVELGLTFDAYCYHRQIPDVIDLARAFPEAPIVLDHIGAPLGLGPYAGHRTEIFSVWRDHMTKLASCANVYVKVGGLGMSLFGFSSSDGPEVPRSEVLARMWKPYVETRVSLFGANRAMLETNFPVDKPTASYAAVWNAFKRISAGCSDDEKAALFAGTARDFYALAV